MRLVRAQVGMLLLLLGLLATGCREPEPTYIRFTSEEGRFEAEFAEEPEREAVSVTAQNTTLSLIAFTAEQPTEAVSVSFVDYLSDIPEAERRAVLNGAATGAASTLQGTLESTSPTSYQGYEALDFVVESEPGKATTKAFLVGSRMYMLQLVQTGEETESESYERLLETFRILPGPSPSPSPAPASPAPIGTASPA